MSSKYEIEFLQDAVEQERATFFIERCLSHNMVDEDKLLELIERVGKIQNQGVGWLLRICMRRNQINKEQWKYFYKLIASVPGQKAGWALDNAIEKGWINKDEFIYFYKLIASIPGQKAGWALDNAIEKGWIERSNFNEYISKIAQVPYQKLGFPLRNLLEKGWIDVGDFDNYLKQAKNVPGQALGWTLRHIYKLGLLDDQKRCKNYITMLSSTEGQELGWFLDILFMHGVFVGDATRLIQSISTVSGQGASWGFRGLIIKNKEIPDIPFVSMLKVPFQNVGWYLRKLVKKGELTTSIYHKIFRDIEDIPGQEPWWVVDVAYEQGWVDAYIFDNYIIPRITLGSKDIDWVILYFLKQGLDFSYLEKYMIDGNEKEFRVILSILSKLEQGLINKNNFYPILEKILYSKNQRAGILMAIGIERSWMKKEDFFGYFDKKVFVDGQSLGWAILFGIRKKWCSKEFIEDTFLHFSKFCGQALGAIFIGMIEEGLINRERYQHVYDSILSGSSDRAEHTLMDYASELGWIRRKDYQDYFTIDDI